MSKSFDAAMLALTYTDSYNTLRFSRRVSIVIAFSFGITTDLFLLENPGVLAEIKTRIVLAIIAAVISAALVIRDRFS